MPMFTSQTFVTSDGLIADSGKIWIDSSFFGGGEGARERALFNRIYARVCVCVCVLES